MSYFTPQNNNNPSYIQQPGQQGPMYQQQHQASQQNQRGQIQQQGGQPPYYVGQPPYGVQQYQYEGNPVYQGYPPNQYQGVYLGPQQQQNPNFICQPGVIVANDSICTYCHNRYILLTERRIGGQTLIAFLLLLFIFWPLCWLPFIIDDCKDKHYFCSQCGKLIYKKTYTMCS